MGMGIGVGSRGPTADGFAHQASAAPVIVTASPIVVGENKTEVETLAATDADTDAAELTWSLSSGADVGRFTLDAETGVLAFKEAKDYEVPDDADGDGSYELAVGVSDGTNTATAELEVTLADEAGTVTLFPAHPRVGTVLQARRSDPDGISYWGKDGNSYWGRKRTWARSSDRSNWEEIVDFGEKEGQNGKRNVRLAGSEYAPTASDLGMYLRTAATYTDGAGTRKTVEVVSDHMVAGRAPAPEITVVELVSGLTYPWGIAFAPDGTMMFTERVGRIKSRLTDGTVQSVSAYLLDGHYRADTGLTGIALDPDFASNRRFYTCLAHQGPVMQVIAWSINDDYTEATRIADPLFGGMPVGNGLHAGCRLRFGPDGYLWVATGDAYEPTGAQDLSSLGGKILRVDASTGDGAPGNPFGTRVYSFGHRHPQGLAQRPGTNEMWSVSHGHEEDDEINMLEAGGNYGWDPDDGFHGDWIPDYHHWAPMTDLVKFPDAIEAKWSSGKTTLATSGGYFLQGDDWDEWDGRLVVAALATQLLSVFEFTADGTFVSQVIVPEFNGTYGRLRTPLLGPDGALYVTTSNGGGADKILRVVPSQAPTFPVETMREEVAENSNPSTVVATVTATDPDGETLTYSLSGLDASSFTIPDAGTGELRATVGLDHETKESYEVVVTATDPYGLSDSITLTISVTDVQETSVLAITGLSNQTVAENVAFRSPTPTLTGTPIGDVTWTLEGSDAADFTIDASTGVVSMVARNFESPVDANRDNVYAVTVKAIDEVDNEGDVSIEVSVTDVVEREIPAQTLAVGEVLELDIQLNFYDRDQRALDYTVESADPSMANVAVDRNGVITIQGMRRGVTAITVTAADRRDERVSQTFAVTVKGPALVALVPRAADLVREGFVRVINHSAEAGEVSVEAIDDTGIAAGSVFLKLNPHETAHFNSVDLEAGNADKGLPEGVGSGEGDWRLFLDSDLDFEVLSYIRTEDGFLTAMHDVVPMRDGTYRVAVFNPGGNPNQVSSLRLINLGGATAKVSVEGVDDAGASPGTTVKFDIPVGRSTTLTASDLESGTGLEGALGDGTGKWRLTVTSDGPLVAMNLLSSPTGHLTNLSTLPRTPDEDGTHVVPLFPAASDALGRQGFVRVVNRSGESGTVSIDAHDDSDRSYPPVALALNARQTQHFNPDDLELGNAEKGLTGSTGIGVGDWRLVLSSDLDIDVLAYIRTEDGFLTSMHDVAPELLGERRVATFNPGSNPNQVSQLRLVNPGAEDAQVTITGIDDAGASPGGSVTVTVPAGASRTVEAADLEAGGGGLAGTLGDGVGKWRLAVASEQPIIVMSLLSSPTGHLTNLSTAPDRGGAGGASDGAAPGT